LTPRNAVWTSATSEVFCPPLLLVLVPVLRELQRVVQGEYGAELWVQPLDDPACACRLHLVGDWGQRSVREVELHLAGLLAACFYCLDWLEEVG
jgi:hypothetical protein